MFTLDGIKIHDKEIISIMKEHLTVVDEQNTIICYKTISDEFYIPFIYWNRLKKLDNIELDKIEFKNKESDFSLKDINIEKNLFVSQKAIIELLYNKINERELYRGLLQEETGRGKTRAMLGLIYKLKLKTLIVVPLKIIQDQWEKEISKFFENKDIDVLIINTAAKLIPEQLTKYGCIILDEVHKYCTTNFSNILWAPVKILIGMTATPNDRLDNKDVINFKHLGKPIYASDYFEKQNIDIGVEEQFNVVINTIKYKNVKPYNEIKTREFGKYNVDYINTLKNMIKDPKRTELIINNIVEQFNNGHNIYVFCEYRDYADLLSNELKNKHPSIFCENIENLEEIVLKGGSTKEDLELANQARIIFTTYSYSTCGLSLKHMTCLIMATPRKTGLQQLIGRVTRRGSGIDKVRLIIDIIDQLPIFNAQYFNNRRLFYKKKGYEIINH